MYQKAEQMDRQKKTRKFEGKIYKKVSCKNCEGCAFLVRDSYCDCPEDDDECVNEGIIYKRY